MFRTMPVVPGAADALWRLSDAGVWIRLITHRLYANWNHAVAVGDTVAWLDQHSIPYRDLCFLGDKPQVEADAYLDDAPHNVVSLRETGAPVLVFSQPYNAEARGAQGSRLGRGRGVGPRADGLRRPTRAGTDAPRRRRRLPPPPLTPLPQAGSPATAGRTT